LVGEEKHKRSSDVDQFNLHQAFADITISTPVRLPIYQQRADILADTANLSSRSFQIFTSWTDFRSCDLNNLRFLFSISGVMEQSLLYFPACISSRFTGTGQEQHDGKIAGTHNNSKKAFWSVLIAFLIWHTGSPVLAVGLGEEQSWT
jgi:hypothetical protein